jgi:tetratricopeptide (TPR) repeat protein
MLGNKEGAESDLQEGFGREPAGDDDLSWITRGFKRQTREPEKALEDFRRAEMINPLSYYALQNQAHVLTEYLKRPAEALMVLNRLLVLYPEMPEARAGRAVVLARLGKKQEALADAEWVKTHAADPLMIYQVAGVYSLTGDTREALHLLATALTRGVGFNELANDPELDPIRNGPEFGRLLIAVQTLQDLVKPAEKQPTD